MSDDHQQSLRELAVMTKVTISALALSFLVWACQSGTIDQTSVTRSPLSVSSSDVGTLLNRFESAPIKYDDEDRGSMALEVRRLIEKNGEEYGISVERELKRIACDPASSPASLLGVSFVLNHVSRSAAVEAVECIVNNHPVEDAILWRALDALGEGPFDSAGVRLLKVNAKDVRTAIRLMTTEEFTKFSEQSLPSQTIVAQPL